MKRRLAGLLAFVMLFVLFSALMVYLLYVDTQAPVPTTAQIAVVLYGEDAERWKAMEAGVGKACGELGMEKPVLLLSGEEEPEVQKRQIESAIYGGAQGLVVAACNSEAMQPWLEEMNVNLPIVMVETGAGQALETVCADDREMGRALAGQLEGTKDVICLPAPSFARQSAAARYEGFLEEAARLGLQVETLPAQEPGLPLQQVLAASLAQKQPGSLVLFDNESLEDAIDAAPAAMVDVELYGVGSSEKVLHATDTGLVSGLCFANEYAMGYLAVEQLAFRLGVKGAKGGLESPVPFALANQTTMFEPSVEELLFPAV